MTIPLPYPDGIFLETASVAPMTEFHQILVPANPYRIMLSIGANLGGQVFGFNSGVSFGDNIGVALENGVVRWTWDDVGPLVQLALWVDASELVDIYVEQLENWPSRISLEAVDREERSRQRTEAAVNINRIRRSISGIRDRLSARERNNAG